MKLHTIEANLTHHEGPILERMNPFVLIKVGMQEWKSEVCFDGGR